MPTINSPTPDATTTSKGKVQLTNDLGGTASAPTVIGITSNPCKFAVYRNTNQTLTATAFTKVAFDTKEFDTGTNFDATTNFRFVAPYNGFYQFNATINVNSAGLVDLSIFKNNLEFKRLVAGVSGNPTAQNGSFLLQLVTSDIIEICAYNGLGSSVTLSGGQAMTFFSGFLVSKT